MIHITSTFIIAASELDFTFVRSSGPGGQNVNKVNSKAVLRWNLLTSASIPLIHRQRVFEKLKAKLTKEGNLILTCDSSRDQIRNRQECLEKLKQLLIGALSVPKSRKKTRPTRSSTRKRLESKTKLSKIKSNRRKPEF